MFSDMADSAKRHWPYASKQLPLGTHGTRGREEGQVANVILHGLDHASNVLPHSRGSGLHGSLGLLSRLPKRDRNG